ncbi:VF530 family protein [Thalassotalea atypica]|uniref:VF530 family protein n=1 Tax=Thalassotalea atypica TaxID=2054316 RepID=UPI0025737907|nr:VF530 family protein [Thalassotalea atypica]
MNSDNIYENNPLHGVKLEQVLQELVDHYGFEILYAYLNLNCFKTNPSIPSSIKFLKKTQWAKDKVEAFYMYQYKSLPKADDKQFELPPRDRVVPAHQKTGAPKELSLEDAERLRLKRAEKTRERASKSSSKSSSDPWANYK